MQTSATSAPDYVLARRTGVPRTVALLVLVSVLLVYLASFGFRSAGYSLLIDGILGNAVLALPALACLVRAAVAAPQRLAFTLIGLAAAAFTVGNLIYIFDVQFISPVPYPSLADIGYLLPYPLLLAAVAVLAYPQLRTLARGTILDGLLGALGCAATGSVLTLQPVLNSLRGSTMELVVGAAYPVADLTLTALIVGIMTFRGGRPGATWLWLGSGMVTFAVADSIYLYRVATDSYRVGTPLDGLWAVGLTLMAVAAILPYRPGSNRPVQLSQALLLPNIFSLIGVTILIYGSVSDRNLPFYAVILIVATLLTAVRRTAMCFAALRQLAISRRQARTDELTQLPNRRDFDEAGQRILAEQTDGQRLAVLMLDLDDFKAVNDTFGHHAGDELLRQIGPRLRRELHEDDLLARLDGDHFGLLLLDSDRAVALAVADRLLTMIAKPFLIDGELQTAAASIGIALYPEDSLDLAVLAQRADVARRDAKTGRHGILTYDPARHGAAQHRLNAREALARHELVLVYQPQFDLQDSRMSGVEALVRWQHPTRGLLLPDAFLPFFEQAGLMAELTLRVLELGAAQVRQWRGTGTDLRLSINLAPSALLRPELIDSIRDTLIGYDLRPAGLTVEITENAMMLDLDRSRRALTELRSLGVQLSLDDYGTGYCSLTYLRDLPLNEVKIDRSFVMNLVPGSTDAAIVASTVQLARTLGLRTVAEGVENPEVLRFLTDLGCDIGQGYLLGRPVAAEYLLAPSAQRVS
ncbi:MAG TPA: bifunctional diguanylate cyclase/phosphodiesterase [Kineosporiaceae bacterium]|nr:bifunctional diguanylate cyclase/phosphodiesterase [Kineosporiaceae bacterium]